MDEFADAASPLLLTRSNWQLIGSATYGHSVTDGAGGPVPEVPNEGAHNEDSRTDLHGNN